MKRKSLLYFAIIAILLIFAAGFMGCDTGSDTGSETPTPTVTPTTTPTGSSSMTGTVVTDAGAPVIGATVTLDVYEPMEPVTTPTEEPTAYPYSEAQIDSTTTDQFGGFTFTGLAADVDYLVTVTQSGKVTIQTVVNLANGDQNFVLTMPNGTGEVMFFMPSPIMLTGEVQGTTAYLSWAFSLLTADEATQIPFDRYMIYCGEGVPIDFTQAPIAEITNEATNSYNTPLPALGACDYALAKRFKDNATGVSVTLYSNDVSLSVAEFTYEGEFGEGTMTYPEGIAIVESGGSVQNIYVGEYVDWTPDGASTNVYGRIQKLNPDGTQMNPPVSFYNYTNELDPIGSVDNMDPWSLAIDSEGNVYVGDYWNDQFIKFSPDGEILNTWYTDGYYMDGIAIGKDSTGQEVVYQADYDYYTVWKYDTDGNLLGSLVPPAEAQVDLYNWYVSTVAVDNKGNVYTHGAYYDSSYGDNWVSGFIVFNASGKYIDQFYTGGYYNYFYGYGCATDNRGNLFVSDDEYYYLRRFSTDGSNLGILQDPDEPFEYPIGIATDSTGRVYCCDGDLDKVKVFAPVP